MDADSPGRSNALRRFRMIEKIGVGAYGSVYKALDIMNNEIIALKVIKAFDAKDGLPQSFYRELTALQTFKHNNLVDYRGVVRFPTETCIMLEFCESDLQKQLIVQPRLQPNQVKHLMFQLLQGLSVLHEAGFAHRDLKPANILIKDGKTLKITDFGLSRQINNISKPLTSKVASLAYRAPELILGSKDYTTAIDIWSAGIIFYELATGEKFPSATSDLSQLDKIFRVTGTPSPSPDDDKSPLKSDGDLLCQLPNWRLASMLHIYPRTLEKLLLDKLPAELADAFNIITSMLSLNPSSRPSASELLRNPFFSNMEEFTTLALPEIPEVEEIHLPRMPIRRPPPILLECN